MNPSVSVLIPVFNGMPYLRDTIRSVIAQSYEDWELIIADNASTDSTQQTVLSFTDPRIEYIRHLRNLGAVENWNFVLAHARGIYACVLGADDLFDSDHLERKVAMLNGQPTSSYIHGAVRWIDPAGAIVPTDVFNCDPVETRDRTLPRYLQVNFANITSIVFRMSSIRDHQLAFDPRYRLMIDWALQLKIAMLSGPVLYDSKPTVSYRIHPASMVRRAIEGFEWPMEALRVKLDALIEYPDVWHQIGIDPTEQSRLLTADLWRFAFQQARSGKLKNARCAWRFFRRFHSIFDVVRGLPRYSKDCFARIGRDVRRSDASSLL